MMEPDAPTLEAPESGPNAGAPEPPRTEGSGVDTPSSSNEAPPLLPPIEPMPAPSPPGEEGLPEPPSGPTDSDPSPPPPPPVAEPEAARACRDIADPLLLDFEQTNGADQAFFGDFSSVFSGGTFVYPELGAAAAPGVDAIGLASDSSQGDWHVSGLVAQTSGFGLFFDCEVLDASRFAGIAFRVQGELAAGAELTFFVGTAGNEVSRAWRIENGNAAAEPSFGRCTPAASEFDGSCRAARVVLPVTSEAVDVLVPFGALAGGSPEPGSNPAEITTLQWSLPAADAAGEPYAVDLRIDDIRFVEAE
ncbi:MAG TPA: hypothetical protein VMG12_38415 [Polyangiaceae bacterium]|nr:hypothetical protein [Polyangiaceae bacterium]